MITFEQAVKITTGKDICAYCNKVATDKITTANGIEPVCEKHFIEMTDG